LAYIPKPALAMKMPANQIPRRRRPPFALHRPNASRIVRCPHGLAFVAQGVAQRSSHSGSVSQFRQNATVTRSVALPSEARWQSIGGGDEEPSVRTDAIDALRASRAKAVNFSACEVPCSLSL